MLLTGYPDSLHQQQIIKSKMNPRKVALRIIPSDFFDKFEAMDVRPRDFFWADVITSPWREVTFGILFKRNSAEQRSDDLIFMFHRIYTSDID